MQQSRRRILVIEDERELARLVELHLRDAGFEVAVAYDGESGLELERGGRFDLVVLDLMLPGIDGLEVCRRLRKQTAYTPVLMLTARSSEIDRVLGLEVGADDYLTKPFSVRELVARIKAVFRRLDAFAAGRSKAVVRLGGFAIDPRRREVVLDGRSIALTAKEFDLLLQFARHPGRVYRRSELLDLVWGYGEGGYEHTVNSHINRLRSKIEADPSAPRYVLTVWGVGYKFFDPQEEGTESPPSAGASP
jgi:DNA-binding response OmpR family regulator